MTAAPILLSALLALWLLATSRRASMSTIRTTALGGACGSLALAVGIFVGTVASGESTATWSSPGLPWSSLLSYAEVDGIAAFLVLLVAVAVLAAILASRDGTRRHPGGLYALILLAGAMTMGAIVSRDLLTFLAFAQWSVVALSLLVGGWGIDPHARQGVRLFTTLTAANGVVLIASTALSTSSGPAPWASFACLFALATYVGIAPLHGWIADALDETPAGVGILVSALSLEIGVAGLVRFALPGLDPVVAADGALGGLVLLAMGMGACGAFFEATTRRALSLSGLWNRGVVLLALLSWTPAGITGGILHTGVHVLFIAGVLPLADYLDREVGSRLLRRQRGWLASRRALALTLVALVLVQSGLPPLAGFLSQVTAFEGIVAWSPIVALMAATASMVGALALVRLVLALVRASARGTGATGVLRGPSVGLVVAVASALLLLVPTVAAVGRIVGRTTRELMGGGP